MGCSWAHQRQQSELKAQAPHACCPIQYEQVVKHVEEQKRARGADGEGQRDEHQQQVEEGQQKVEKLQEEEEWTLLRQEEAVFYRHGQQAVSYRQ